MSSSSNKSARSINSSASSSSINSSRTSVESESRPSAKSSRSDARSSASIAEPVPVSKSSVAIAESESSNGAVASSSSEIKLGAESDSKSSSKSAIRSSMSVAKSSAAGVDEGVDPAPVIGSMVPVDEGSAPEPELMRTEMPLPVRSTVVINAFGSPTIVGSSSPVINRRVEASPSTVRDAIMENIEEFEGLEDGKLGKPLVPAPASEAGDCSAAAALSIWRDSHAKLPSRRILFVVVDIS